VLGAWDAVLNRPEILAGRTKPEQVVIWKCQECYDSRPSREAYTDLKKASKEEMLDLRPEEEEKFAEQKDEGERGSRLAAQWVQRLE
jgi:hypothetical protein